MAFVARGYFSGGTNFSLYVDGQLKSRFAGPLGTSLSPGSSVMAVRSEEASATLGAKGLTLSDVLVLTHAIEPHEM